jgi:hypothetical protein
MDLRSRDAFDSALVVVALVLVYVHSATTPDPQSVVGSVVSALVSLPPVVYLVILGVVGIGFMAYGLLYLPSQAGGR